MRTILTEKQVAKLKKNPCVFSCTRGMVHYTYEFKIRAIELQRQGISPNAIWKRAGFDTSIWKKNYCNDTVKDWRRLVRKGGLRRLTARGGIPSDTGTKEEKVKLKRLELQVKYLEAENDFLAKLRAKRAESNSGLKKNIKSSNN
ncbi:MAG: HTH domain-containing protein [Candidatus Paceibacterota bacterium]